MDKKKVAVLLSGCGVYDGSEIHESVLTLLALEERNIDYLCIAPDTDQHHVINHLNGDEMKESRNVLIESARIARGDIKSVTDVSSADFDAIVLPGGFGTAKNITKWAFSGPDGDINKDVKSLINNFISEQKPVVALCMSPTTVAKALEGSDKHAELTVGTTSANSPYEIEAISQGMEKTGAKSVYKTVDEIAFDQKNKIITTPCYMMEANILEINTGIKKAIDKLVEIL
ncbi:MAG: isoprenoid biosynthesis protein ElbB [Chitinophagaceae bacterium]|nr:MAG: isoprenoid biosynthesis protein ElbB [Chitinophagaceae bacterium]